MPQTVVLKQQKFIPYSSKVDKFKIKVLANLVSGERSFWLSCSLYMAEKGGEIEQAGGLSGVSSSKGTNPIGSGPCPYDLINLDYLLMGPISKYSHIIGEGVKV